MLKITTMIIGILLFIFSCGVSETFDHTLPYNSRVRVNHQEIQILQNEIRLVKERLLILEGKYEEIEQTIFDRHILLDELSAKIELNHMRMDDLQELINLHVENVDEELDRLETDYNAKLDLLEIRYDSILVQVGIELDELLNQIQDQEVEAIWPCGENMSQEILLNTSIGLVAYFESGNSHYLSILSSGNYSTTDGFACNFVVLDGEIIN